MEEFLLKNLNRGYFNLVVWREAVALAVKVRKKINGASNISFKLKAQIEDSIVSVPSNIAEGYSRRHLKEYIQHINYALGSLSENFTQLLILKESAHLDKEWFNEYDKNHYSIENKLLALNKKLLLKCNSSEWNDTYKVKLNP